MWNDLGINHSLRLDFSDVITEIIKENNKEQQSLPSLFSSKQRSHQLGETPEQSGWINKLHETHLRWKQELSYRARKRSTIPPPPVSSPVTGKQCTCYQQKPKHLLLSEAFKSAADDDKRLFMAASVGLRFAVEVDRLLAA